MGYRGSILTIFLLCAAWSTAQITLGDNLHMRMNGTAGVGYNGGYANLPGSFHGLGFGFDGLLDGYYFDPRFVNFDVRPYYNRNQANSAFQTISRGTGVNTSAGIFSNTIYPGSVSYGYDTTTNSEYQIAGVPSVASNNTSQTLGVGWGLLLPNKPTLTANYAYGKSSGNIIGTDMNTYGSSQNLTVASNYVWSGWQLGGAYSYFKNNYTTPEFLTGEALNVNGSSSSIYVTAQHNIPLEGSLSLGYSHGSSEGNGDHSSGSSYSVGAGISPWGRLALGSSFSYATSGSQFFVDSVLGPGGNTIPLENNFSLMFLYNSAAINIGYGFQLIGHMSWRRQDYGSSSITNTQYGGTVAWHYNKRWLQGFYFAVGVVDTANQGGNGGTGMNASVGMDRRFGRWETSADFSYTHDLETAYNVTNTSYLNYGGNIRRKLNPQTYLAVFGRVTHSGFVQQTGSSNGSESFGASINWKGYSLNSSFSAANGTAVLSGNGILVPTANGPIFTPNYVYFNAKAFSASIGKYFRFRLSASASYSQVYSSSHRTDLSNNTAEGNRIGANMTYTYRQLVFNGGYSNVNQQFRFEPSLGRVFRPQSFNSFYVSVFRHFDIF